MQIILLNLVEPTLDYILRVGMRLIVLAFKRQSFITILIRFFTSRILLLRISSYTVEMKVKQRFFLNVTNGYVNTIVTSGSVVREIDLGRVFANSIDRCQIYLRNSKRRRVTLTERF